MKAKEVIERYHEIREYWNDHIENVLDEMYKKGELTVGARYYVYGFYRNYHIEQLFSLYCKAMEKFSNNKSYKTQSQALCKVASNWTWNYHLKKAEEFVKEVEELIAQYKAKVSSN